MIFFDLLLFSQQRSGVRSQEVVLQWGMNLRVPGVPLALLQAGWGSPQSISRRLGCRWKAPWGASGPLLIGLFIQAQSFWYSFSWKKKKRKETRLLFCTDKSICFNWDEINISISVRLKHSQRLVPAFAFLHVHIIRKTYCDFCFSNADMNQEAQRQSRSGESKEGKAFSSKLQKRERKEKTSV